MYISRCAHVLLQLLKRKSSHPTTNLTSSHASSILAVHQQKGFNFPMLTRSGGAGPNFEVGLGRGGGEEIDIYFIIYFQCLHLCVVPSLNGNR